MFLNCLLLDLTFIYLMSIVHKVKIWVEIAKKFEMRTSGGGGSSVIADTPGRGGRGGQKRENFCGRPLWTAPKVVCTLFARDFAAMGSYSFNPQSRFPDHSAESTEEDCIGKARSALL